MLIQSLFQILTELKSEDGIQLRKLSRMVEDFEDNLIHYGNCEVIVRFTKESS